ncbi:hypothetical protein IGI57_002581 [Enterococcus sp. DIV0213j]|uniref:tape measure protein n=1 Tax=Enterococcus sp. DIV0213j TaxID=2774649 RepID=UPI003D2BCACE
MAEDAKVGGAKITISADSGPAEKAVASFFGWFEKTGEKATELANKISENVERVEEFGRKGVSSVKRAENSFSSMRRTVTNTTRATTSGFLQTQKTITDVNKVLSKDTKKTFQQMKTDAKLSYSEMTKDSKAMNRALVISTKESLKNLKSSFGDLKNGFKTLGTAIVDLFKKPINTVKAVPSNVKSAMKSVSSFVSSGFAQAKNLAISQVESLKTGIASIPEKAKIASNRTKDFFVTGFNSLINSTATVISKIGNYVGSIPSRTSQSINQFKTNFVNGLKSIPSNAKNAVSNTANFFTSGFKNIWSSAKSTFSNLGNMMRNGVEKPTGSASLSLKGMTLAFAGAQLAVKALEKAFAYLKAQIGAAVDRFDTMQRYPKVMAALGFSAEQSNNSISALSDGIDGLPTKLQDIVAINQQFISTTGEIDNTTQATLALNNAFLASGASTSDANRGMTQYLQMLSTGKVDLVSWRTMMETMPVALTKVAESFGFTGQSAKNDLYAALDEGTISFDQFQDKLIELGTGTGLLATLAKENSKGIRTSFSNLGNSISKGMANVLTKIDEITQALTGSTIATHIDNLKVVINKAFDSIVKSLDSVIPFIDKMKEWKKELEPWIPLFYGLGAAIAFFTATTVVLPAILSGIVSVVGALASGLGTLFATIAAANPFVLFGAILVGLVVAFKNAYANNEKFRQSVDKLVAIIKEKAIAAFEKLKEYIQLLKDKYIEMKAAFNERFGEAVTAAAEAMNVAFEKLKDGFDRLKEGFIVVKDAAADLIKSGLSKIGPGFKSISDAISSGFTKGLELVGDLLENMGGVFGKLGGVISIIVSVLTKFGLAALGITGPIGIVISLIVSFLSMWARTGDMSAGGITKVFDQLNDTISNAADMIAKYLPVIVETIADILVKIIEKVTEYVPVFVETFSKILTKVTELIVQYLPMFIDLAIDILTKLIEGITIALPIFIDAMLNVFTKIVDLIVELLPTLIDLGTQILVSIINGIVTALPVIIDVGLKVITGLIQAIAFAIPFLLKVGFDIISAILSALIDALPMLLDIGISLAGTLLSAITNVLPVILEAGVKILLAIIGGIISMLPTLISAALKIILALVGALIESLPKIIGAGIKLLLALINGILSILPKLISAAIFIILALVKALIDNLPQLISAGIKLLNALVNGIISMIPVLIDAALKIIIAIVKALIDNFPKIAKAGWDLLVALGDGIIQAIVELVKVIPKIYESMKKGFSDIDWAGIGKNVLDGVIGGITSKAKEAKDKIFEVGGNIAGWFKEKLGIASPSKVMAKLARWVPEGIAVGIDKGQKVVESSVGVLTNIMQKTVTDAQPVDLSAGIKTESYGMPDASQMLATAKQVSNAGNQGMADSSGQLLQTALSSATGIIDQFSSVAPQMQMQGAQWLINFMNGWKSVVSSMMRAVTAFIAQYRSTITAQNNPNYQLGRTWLQNNLNGWNSVVSTFVNRVRAFCNQVLSLLRSFNNAMTQNGRTWLQNILNGWNSLYSSFVNRVNQLGNDAINNLRGKNNGFKNAGSFLMKSLIDGINSMGSSLDTTMRGVANKMVSGIGRGVNGVIGGVNYVMSEVESKKRLNAWTVPKYATGTDAHPGGLAVINDQKGPVHQEYVEMPDGRGFLAKGRDLLVNLPKGAKVLNATLTDRMMKAKDALSGFVPHYEKGIGNFDVVDLLDDANALTKFLNGKVDYKDVNEPWLDMTKSAVKVMANAADPFVQSKLSDYFTHGNFDGAINANGVFQYLVDVAQKVMSKFPGLTVTSGYREGDPHYHGKRQAIDLAVPGKSNIPMYTEAANYAFEKFSNKIAYVITNGRVRDRSGMSGTGSSGQWTPWPDGDHFDHIHLNGLLGTGNVFTGGSSGGSGVERWRSIAIKALRMENQYSPANLNALLNQMRTESNGDPRAINLWDDNAKAGIPSKGLMQVIDPTFKAYGRPGFISNIYDPLSNILASIRYTLRTYGSLVAGWRGVGYENGGMVTKDGLYRMGEGNKAEMVLPLTKPKRTFELIGQALNYMSQNGSNILDTAKVGLNNLASNMTLNLMDLAGYDTQNIRNSFAGQSNLDLQQVIRLLEQNNQLLAQIRDQESDIYMDSDKVGRKVAKPVMKEINKEEKLSERRKGRLR